MSSPRTTYIDYLSRSPIESLVPVQILDKLRDSHCLFLGYTVRDWNLRVFLKRIWEGGLSGPSRGRSSQTRTSWRRISGRSLTWISMRPTWRTTWTCFKSDLTSAQHDDEAPSHDCHRHGRGIATEPDSPYVGLNFYTQENAAMFFGRDTERTVLISNLRASRLTLLYAQERSREELPAPRRGRIEAGGTGPAQPRAAGHCPEHPGCIQLLAGRSHRRADR